MRPCTVSQKSPRKAPKIPRGRPTGGQGCRRFFVCGLSAEIIQFFKAIDVIFPLGVFNLSRELHFLGFSISVYTDGSACMDMDDKLWRILRLSISRERQSKIHLSVDDRERPEYLSLADVLLYLGQSIYNKLSTRRPRYNSGLEISVCRTSIMRIVS